jgi:diguanylate cyclase (GGDEF)-like protein/PAS domain S-box-containing protein
MPFKKLLHNIKQLDKINTPMVDTLYYFAKRNIFILMVLTIVVVVLLYPIISNRIIYWGIALEILLVLRFYSIYAYKNMRRLYTLKQWYIIYLFSALIVASFFSSLSFLFMLEVSFYYQLLIIMVILGLSSGSVTALSIDYRLAIIYLSILLFPLMAVITLIDTELNYILLFALILYYIAQVGMIIKNYQHEEEFSLLISEQDRFNHLFEEAPLGIFTYDKDMIITDCNNQFLLLFDNDREQLVGFNLNDIPDTKPLKALKNALSEGAQIYRGYYLSIKGKEFWVEAKIFPYKNKLTDTVGSIVLIEDKTKEHNIQKELEYVATHDVLTGLLNRRGLYSLIDETLTGKEHSYMYTLLFYLDLNQFKGINDSLGHSVGDSVLLSVSERLVYALESDCSISRLGGDEFIILKPYISDNAEMAKEIAAKYADYVQSLFDTPFIIDDLHLHVQTSIGIIIIEPKYQNIEEIIRHADLTMYQAKNESTRISYYNEALDIEQRELFSLQHSLAYAVEREQFDMFFQPIVTIKEEKLYAAEALIRWEHPEKGLLTPESFIPLAIKAGLLSNITWWVVDQVCRHIVQWKKDNVWSLEYISINVNAQQLIEQNFAIEFLAKLSLHGLKTTDILIEITERSLIDNFESTQSVITALRKEGVRCAIDDFGVGYSSLSYLKKLSFHTLKIDREFVKDIESKPKELLLVSTILDIGRQFNYHIVIEGIEDKKQKDLLLGLDENLSYQGYHFSKPLHAEEFREKFLNKN